LARDYGFKLYSSHNHDLILFFQMIDCIYKMQEVSCFTIYNLDFTIKLLVELNINYHASLEEAFHYSFMGRPWPSG
jgi:hypothetical protein